VREGKRREEDGEKGNEVCGVKVNEIVMWEYSFNYAREICYCQELQKDRTIKN
jgi:hypothetical protein